MDEALYDLARRAFHSFRRRLESGTVVHGVSPGQWRFLRQLWHSNGISQRKLAAQLAISEATATVTLRELENKGLVDRRRNAGNRREVLIFLTQQGHALEQTLLPVARDLHSRATHNMPAADVTALDALLRRVIANLDHE
ncbi:MarR family transcriptional regulator [Sphingopyxis sp.]|uniref:MarR family winged helix-turn-helix transcriptional regulator n=1 Tax=Sphingopyxis sp. TaxID=1908224 RepID=UPI0025FC73A7|nr:MarR family transcriptional regulator [Sphingopyxis sp.]MBR2174249.1 MarR family transcriptional regulator [Sphingopyxis sp.]